MIFMNKKVRKESKDTYIEEMLAERLDLVFDLAHERKIQLSEEDVKSYVDFSKKNTLEIKEFIDDLKRNRFIYLCSPINYNPYAFGEQNNIVPIIYKCEVLDVKLHSVTIRDGIIFNVSGEELRIKDKYIFEIEKLSGDLSELHLELFSDDVLRLRNRGSIIDYYGDILSLTESKAYEDMKKYFG